MPERTIEITYGEAVQFHLLLKEDIIRLRRRALKDDRYSKIADNKAVTLASLNERLDKLVIV